MTNVTVNDFIETLVSEPGPQCLMWLPIFQRLAAVENGKQNFADVILDVLEVL